jgi:hypothetical protein
MRSKPLRADRAWGAYRTEFYPTYDFKPVAEEQRKTQ